MLFGKLFCERARGVHSIKLEDYETKEEEWKHRLANERELIGFAFLLPTSLRPV